MLIAILIVVPIIIDRPSRNLLDVKDFALGVGVLLGLCLWLLASLARGRVAWASSRLNLAVGAYLLWAVVSVAYSRYRYASVSEVVRLAAHVGLYWLVIASVRDIAQTRRLIGAAAIAAVPVCIYGFVQAAGRDPVRWDTSTGRVFSLLGNATYLAGFLVLLIPLALAAAWPRGFGRAQNRPANARASHWAVSALFLLAAGMMLVCLYYTVTISPTIGLLIGTVAAVGLLMIRGGARNLRAIATGSVVGLLVFGGLAYVGYRNLPQGQQWRIQQVIHLQDPYGKERGMIQRAGIGIFRQHPVVGGGYGTYRIYALERLAPSWYGELGGSTSSMLVPNYAHNEFIGVLAEVGVIGGALFLAMFLAAYGSAVRVFTRHPDRDWGRLGLAIAVGITAFLFQNLFGITFRQTGTVTLFWLWLGFLGVAAAGVPARHAAEADRSAETEDLERLRVREMEFRPVPSAGMVGVGAALALLVTGVSWAAIRPMRSNILVKRAESLAKTGDFKASAELADEAIRLNPYSSLAHYVAAYAWGSLGDHERSLEANKRALALLPANASVYYNLGVNYKRLGRLEEAREHFQRAIDLMPTAVRHYGAMAELLIAMGRYDEALSYARQAERLSPDDPSVLLLVADVEARRRNLKATAAYLDRAAKLAPGDVNILRQLALLAFRLKDFNGAIGSARKWLEVDPSAVPAYLLMASSYYNLRDYQGARAALEAVMKIAPDNPEVRLNLAYTYAKLGQPHLATAQVEWLARERPDSREGQIATKLLSEWRRASAGPAAR